MSSFTCEASFAGQATGYTRNRRSGAGVGLGESVIEVPSPPFLGENETFRFYYRR